MRAVFGLVGILVTLGVIVMIMHSYTLPAAKTAVQQKKQVEEQFSMSTREGLEDARASITLQDAEKGNKFDGLLVQNIVAGGAMSKTFGLVQGDTIVAINGLRFRGVIEPEMARDMLFEAKGRRQSLTVLRNGQELEIQPQY